MAATLLNLRWVGQRHRGAVGVQREHQLHLLLDQAGKSQLLGKLSSRVSGSWCSSGGDRVLRNPVHAPKTSRTSIVTAHITDPSTRSSTQLWTTFVLFAAGVLFSERQVQTAETFCCGHRRRPEWIGGLFDLQWVFCLLQPRGENCGGHLEAAEGACGGAQQGGEPHHPVIDQCTRRLRLRAVLGKHDCTASPNH